MPHARAPGHALCRLFDVFYHGRLRTRILYQLPVRIQNMSVVYTSIKIPACLVPTSKHFILLQYLLLLQENNVPNKKDKKTHSPFKKGFDIDMLHKTHTFSK